MSDDFFFLHIRLIIFNILIAIALAKLEIQIEGKYGWAEKLPTWRLKNKWTQLFWGEQPYTGYHFWLLISIILFLHFPFVLNPSSWSAELELLIIGYFFLGVILEDYFWFVFNPHFGRQKFTNTHAPWHKKWIMGIPELYVKVGTLSILIIFIATYLSIY